MKKPSERFSQLEEKHTEAKAIQTKAQAEMQHLLEIENPILIKEADRRIILQTLKDQKDLLPIGEEETARVAREEEIRIKEISNK